MDNQLSTTINLIENGNLTYVSSKEVAERFEKRHDNVIRDIERLQVPDTFKNLNFEEIYDVDTYGRQQKTYLMTKDGFSILAFGFTGKQALGWKLMFLEAFNKMESYIKEKIPLLEARIKSLETEKDLILLEQKKPPHPNKGTVIIPIVVNTLFGPDIEYKRVKKENKNYSDLSYKEGELKRLTQCTSGMVRRMDELAKDIALSRRN